MPAQGQGLPELAGPNCSGRPLMGWTGRSRCPRPIAPQGATGLNIGILEIVRLLPPVHQFLANSQPGLPVRQIEGALVPLRLPLRRGIGDQRKQAGDRGECV
jgi:hypothetical protein